MTATPNLWRATELGARWDEALRGMVGTQTYQTDKESDREADKEPTVWVVGNVWINSHKKEGLTNMCCIVSCSLSFFVFIILYFLCCLTTLLLWHRNTADNVYSSGPYPLPMTKAEATVSSTVLFICLLVSFHCTALPAAFAAVVIIVADNSYAQQLREDYSYNW